MSIDSVPDFEGYLKSNWSQLKREDHRRGSTEVPKKEAARITQLYQNVIQGQLPFCVLGLSNIREDESLLLNMGTISTDPQMDQKVVKEFFRAMGEEVPKKRRSKDMSPVDLLVKQGGILNESNWWILPNDAFMLGGIHAAKEFHLATEKGRYPDAKYLWDSEQGRPTAFGRELLILAHCGYRQMGPEKRGYEIVLKLPAFLHESILDRTLEELHGVIRATNTREGFINKLREMMPIKEGREILPQIPTE